MTIIATALVETGSRMDDVIYEEFKGTGNNEIHLDRKIAEKRIYPAISLNRSGTRREELLLGPDLTPRVWLMRRMYDQMINVGGLDSTNATESILKRLEQTADNQEFLEKLIED